MKDRFSAADVCGMGLRDPDFRSNDCQVWAICGPYCRKDIDRGDIVFFVPKVKAIRKAGLDGHVCTGMLVVKEKLSDFNNVLIDSRLTKDYKRIYKADLAAHLKQDKQRTKEIRPHNFIIGDRSKSKRFGRNEKYVPALLHELGFDADNLQLRRIPDLDEQQARSLYSRLSVGVLARCDS